MKGSTLIRAALSLGLAAAAPTNPPDEDIVGGKTVTDPTEYPYIALMRSNGQFICGGTILSSTKILTAAHCAVDGSASEFSFRVGSLKASSGGKIYQAKSKSVHPKYDANTVDYDVAVITLSSPITFSSTVAAAKLTSSGAETRSGQGLTVIGWGATSEGGNISENLLQVSVPVVDHDTCADDYSSGGTISDRMFCAASSGKDSCNGDSGGPIIDTSSGTLVGGVSWGQGCAEAGFPGVYADYADSELNSFIKSNL